MSAKYGDRTNVEPYRRGTAQANGTTIEQFDAVFVGVGGAGVILEITTSEGGTLRLTGVLSGTIYPIEGVSITNNTTATGCTVLYH